LDSEDDDRTSAAATSIEAREEFRHVRRGVSKARPSSQPIENPLQFRTSRNDHTSIDRVQIEQETKVIKVTIKKWIFVVPFYFERNTVLVAVDLMRGCHELIVVHYNLCIELLLYPTKARKMTIETTGDKAL